MWDTGGMILGGETDVPEKKTLPQCHFYHHKYELDWPDIELGSLI